MSSARCERSRDRVAVQRLLTIVAVAFLAFPAAAAAHLRSGTVAVDYRASVLNPETDAYVVGIYQSDRGLNLTLKPGHVVLMLGYLGEPVFRLDTAGLWVNAASPTAVVAGLLTKAQRIDASTPHWRLERGRDSTVWHDARVQGLPSGVDHGAWSVPLLVDGRRVRLTGYLSRFPAPSLWLWLGVLACLLGAGTSPLMLRRREPLRAGAIGCALVAIAASVVIALAFALDTYASAGTWIEGLDEIAFLAVGLGVLLRGPENFHVGAAIGSGLVGVAVGLSKGAVFLHAIVLAILPGTAVRLLVIAAIGAGLAAAALGCMLYVETATPVRESEPPEWSAAGRFRG
jgi:hypothetical protein